MATKCEMFMNFSEKFIGIYKKMRLPNMEY